LERTKVAKLSREKEALQQLLSPAKQQGFREDKTKSSSFGIITANERERERERLKFSVIG